MNQYRFVIQILLYAVISSYSLYTPSLSALTVLDKLFTGNTGDSITWDLRGHTTQLTIVEIDQTEITLLEKDADSLPQLHVLHRNSRENPKGFISTLFSLNLIEVPLNERKKGGPAPHPGEIDLRKVWNPKIKVNGESYTLPCTAYKVQWPQDDSDLSGKQGLLYYAPPPATQAFPYWIEVATSPNPVHIWTIDSTNLRTKNK